MAQSHENPFTRWLQVSDVIFQDMMVLWSLGIIIAALLLSCIAFAMLEWSYDVLQNTRFTEEDPQVRSENNCLKGDKR